VCASLGLAAQRLALVTA